MSFVKVCIHSVWGTKNRFPFLSDDLRNKICEHIIENARGKQILIDTIDGYTDHLHCLYFLNADITIAKSLQLIKGESSIWFNRQNFIKNKFEWADEYFAVSVSESMIETVRSYIRNQKEHHKKITFEEEYKKFITAYNLK